MLYLKGYIVEKMVLGWQKCEVWHWYHEVDVNIDLIFQQLYSLHTHNKYPIIHSDPRLENLMVVDKHIDQFFWIDLATSQLIQTSAQINFGYSNDLTILIHSVFPEFTKQSKSNELIQLINNYSHSCSLETFTHVILYLENYHKKIQRNDI